MTSDLVRKSEIIEIIEGKDRQRNWPQLQLTATATDREWSIFTSDSVKLYSYITTERNSTIRNWQQTQPTARATDRTANTSTLLFI